MLRLLSLAMGTAVREHEDAVIALDHATLAAHVAGQPGVVGRVQAADNDLIAGREPGRHVDIDPAGAPRRDQSGHHVLGQQGHHATPATTALRASSSSWVSAPFSTKSVSSAASQCS